MSLRAFLAILTASALPPCLTAAPAAASAPAPSDAGAAGTIIGEEIIPLTTVVSSGHRYVAGVDFGLGAPVPLMIHGNSRMFLSLTHHVGERISGGPVGKVEEYGYSARGKGAIDVPVMRLGGRRLSNLPAVPVFDFGEERDTLVQGMVGVPFLTSERAAVDFSRDVMILGVAPSEAPSRRLLDAGYQYARINVDARNRVTMEVYFPRLGRSLSITPSTVSNALTLHRPLFAGKVKMKKAPHPDRSPSGTSPDEFVSDGVEFEIAGARFRNPASFEDLADYANVREAELDSFGMLGFDWMKQHKAILDYANRVLYFRP